MRVVTRLLAGLAVAGLALTGCAGSATGTKAKAEYVATICHSINDGLNAGLAHDSKVYRQKLSEALETSKDFAADYKGNRDAAAFVAFSTTMATMPDAGMVGPDAETARVQFRKVDEICAR